MSSRETLLAKMMRTCAAPSEDLSLSLSLCLSLSVSVSLSLSKVQSGVGCDAHALLIWHADVDPQAVEDEAADLRSA